MNRETALTATIAFNSPMIVQQRLPEDASQALIYLNSILSLNDDAKIAPGDLHGMSLMLANARNTWREMRRGEPTSFMPFASSTLEGKRALSTWKIKRQLLGNKWGRGAAHQW